MAVYIISVMHGHNQVLQLLKTQKLKIGQGTTIQTQKNLILLIILVCTVFFTSAYSQDFTFSKLIADTLVINLPEDSTLTAPELPLQIRDNRETPGPVLGIRQIKKWLYIPVDQYLALSESLSTTLGKHLPADLVRPGDTLVIDKISIWYDGSLMFLKGWTLNGRTQLVDGGGAVIRDWQWEHRVKKKRKQKPEDAIGRLVGEWTLAQGKALKNDLATGITSPYRYRRQLMFWLDTIILPDGYVLNGRLSLDFPTDQMDRYIRGAPGMEMYYYKSSRHESIAVGGKHQQWLVRLRPSWLGRLNLSYRIGGNRFNPDKFDYIDWWNILLVNVGLTAAMEYRPRYHKGLFAGAGLHQMINVLPEIVTRYEVGLLLTVGMVLP
ncbi:MAG: hypothetical protein JSU77_07595 [Fidelibacterota bacterium]|nr:MAG: hypothetical protein JSU77_07595 [Candidatus Neomarinimicrobiota bacterium]